MLFASLVLASCNSKEIATPDGGSSESGIPFEVSTVITKTTNDDRQTNWASGDAINLFHAEAGATSSYTSDGKFAVDEALTGVFSGELAKALEEDNSYDWYAFYPYTSKITTPANKKTGWVTVGGTSQTQTGNDSMAHLAGASCPLYGVVKNVASSEKPAFEMNQLVSVVAVNVTNTLADAITVSNVSFTSTEDIVGTYYIDFSGDTPAYTSSGSSYVSETAKLIVKDGASIAQNGSATFYIAIKPHTAASGSALKISVNGIEKTLTLTKDVTFEAGYIKTVKYSYDYDEDYSGTYLILDKDKTKVCPAYTTGKSNISAVDYVESNIQDSWLMTIEKVAGTNMYTIKDANGLYLSATSNKDNQLKGLSTADENNSYWNITANSDGTYSVVATKSSNRGVLQYNKTSTLFSCYNAASQTAVTLYPYSPLPRIAAPDDVEAEVQDLNSVYVLWSQVDGAKDYTVTCGDRTVTVEGEDYTFTGLSYSTEYEVSVVANPNDTDTYWPSIPTTRTVTTGANPSGALTYTYTITASVFSGSGYGKDINEINAKSSDETKEKTVTHKGSNVGNVSNKIQFKKSTGVLYNTTDLGSVKSVVLEGASTSSYVVYIGSSENPTSIGSGGYFTIKNQDSSNLLTCTSITVTFEI